MWEKEKEGHDGPVSLHWLISKFPSYQTLKYLGIGLSLGPMARYRAISPYISQCKTSDPRGGAKSDPRAIIWALLIHIHYMKLHAKFSKPSVTDDHSFKHGCFPIYIQYLTTALGRILFSSVVMVLAYQSGGPGSNPARIIYFCHAFIHFFLCYGLCS